MATYTLDYDTTTNEIVITVNNGGAIVYSRRFRLGEFKPILRVNYTDADQLITDQQIWNFLDAIKDGINKQLLMQLNIYPKAVGIYGYNSNDTLHAYENGLLDRSKGNLVRRTWTKTKDKSAMNYVTVDSYLWESGLGYQTFIKITPDGSDVSITTFGSYIDPLSKPGVSWPPVNETIVLTSNLMEHTGFGKSKITATTNSGDGKQFVYDMDIKCGDVCLPANACTLPHHNGSTVASDPNRRLFAGNNEKNLMLKGSATTIDKVQTTVMKGWGDKMQVLIYFMYYYLEKFGNRDTRMITADMVVYSLCITLNIPCIYTGLYDRPVTVSTYDSTGTNPGSFYSILEFNPGTPAENMKQSYMNKMKEVYAENEETIASMQYLVDHPDTLINIQGVDQKFTHDFYEDVMRDMMAINGRLDTMLKAFTPVAVVLSAQQMLEINDLIASIDYNYLIIPIIKNRGGRLIMLLGNSYLLNKEEGRKKPAIDTRLYGKPVIRLGVGASFLSIATEYRKIRTTGGRRRQKGGVLTPNVLALFPKSDRTPKIFEYLEEHKHAVGDQDYTHQNVDNADVFSKSDEKEEINLQKELDRTFNESFLAVHNDGTYNLHETLYTLYIYNCQMRRGANYMIHPKDIRDLERFFEIHDVPYLQTTVQQSKHRNAILDQEQIRIRNPRAEMIELMERKRINNREANLVGLHHGRRRRRDVMLATRRNPATATRRNTAQHNDEAGMLAHKAVNQAVERNNAAQRRAEAANMGPMSNGGALKRRGGRTHKKSNKRNKTRKRKH
jgi:hypothetical protein